MKKYMIKKDMWYNKEFKGTYYMTSVSTTSDKNEDLAKKALATSKNKPLALY